jgi:trigger factor
MMVSVEALKGLERRMQVSVPASRVEQQVDKRLLNVSRTARIKGFRPGKAPIHVVRKHYGAQVREEVVSDLIRETFAEALQREQLVPAGGPRIEPLTAGKGDLKYAATFEIYPKIELRGVEGMELVRPTAEVADSDVDAMLESLRRQRPDFVAVERAAADGDRLTIDFEGRLDGESFEGGKAEGHQFTLGAGRMLKDFEDGLRGAKSGEERSFDVSFPADYPATNLAGKTAHFTVNVKAVEETRLPEVDDEFCKAFGVAEGGVGALRAEVRENMERELAQAIRGRMKSQVMDKLLAANPLDLPAVLVDQEVRDMQLESLRRMGARNASQLPPRGPFEANARRRVSLGLLLNEVIRAASIKVDAAKLQERLDDLVAGFEDAESARRQYLENEDTMRQLQMMVLEDQVVEHIVGKAKVTDERAAFKDIMNFGTAEASQD